MLLIASLQVVFYYSKPHWLFEALLHYVIVDRQFHYIVIYPLFRPRLFVKLLWFFFHPLWRVVFWTKVKGIGSLEIPSILFHVLKIKWKYFPLGGCCILLGKKQLFLNSELEEFISHMKHQVLKVLLPFISFMHEID